MGEIADDMVDGTTCSLCGCFFQDPEHPDNLYSHGYPVVCWECWKDLSQDERKEYQRALVPTIGE